MRREETLITMALSSNLTDSILQLSLSFITATKMSHKNAAYAILELHSLGMTETQSHFSCGVVDLEIEWLTWRPLVIQ